MVLLKNLIRIWLKKIQVRGCGKNFKTVFKTISRNLSYENIFDNNKYFFGIFKLCALART